MRTCLVPVLLLASFLTSAPVVLSQNAGAPATNAAADARLDPADEAALRALAEACRAPARSSEERRASLRALDEKVAAIRATGFEPLKDIDAWARILSDRPHTPADVRPGEIVSRPFEGYHFALPKDYDSARAYPLIICLHATGETGLDFIERYWRRPNAPTAILFAPDWPSETPVRWSDPSQLTLTLGTVGDAILQRFNVDRNRIFLDGAKDGGTEAWRLATYFAPLLAGVIVRHGLPAQDDAGGTVSFSNLRDLKSLYFHVNDEVIFGEGYVKAQHEPVLERWLIPSTAAHRKKADALFDFYWALDNINHHTVFPGGAIAPVPKPLDGEKALAAMADRVRAFVSLVRRDPFPTPITWRVFNNSNRRAYWIRSIDEEYALTREPATFEVYADRKRNRIEINCSRIRGFEIQLNDKIVNLDRRLLIIVNGKRAFDGMPSRSVARVLRAVQRSGDPYDIFPWGTRIEIDGAEQ